MIILVQELFECNLHLTLQWPTCEIVYSLKVDSMNRVFGSSDSIKK